MGDSPLESTGAIERLTEPAMKSPAKTIDNSSKLKGVETELFGPNPDQPKNVDETLPPFGLGYSILDNSGGSERQVMVATPTAVVPSPTESTQGTQGTANNVIEGEVKVVDTDTSILLPPASPENMATVLAMRQAEEKRAADLEQPAEQKNQSTSGDEATAHQKEAARQDTIRRIEKRWLEKRYVFTSKHSGTTPTQEQEDQWNLEAVVEELKTNDPLVLMEYQDSAEVRHVLQMMGEKAKAAAESRTNTPQYPRDVRPPNEVVEEFFAGLPPEVQANISLHPLAAEFLKTGDYSREAIQALHNELQDVGEQILLNQSAGLEKEQKLRLNRSTVREVLLLAWGTDRIVDGKGQLIMMRTQNGEIVPIDPVTYVVNITSNPDYNPNLGDAIETLLLRKLRSRGLRGRFEEELPEIENNIQMLRYLEYKDMDPKTMGDDLQRRAQALEAIGEEYKDNFLLRLAFILMGKLLHMTMGVTDKIGTVDGSKP